MTAGSSPAQVIAECEAIMGSKAPADFVAQVEAAFAQFAPASAVAPPASAAAPPASASPKATETASPNATTDAKAKDQADSKATYAKVLAAAQKYLDAIASIPPRASKMIPGMDKDGKAYTLKIECPGVKREALEVYLDKNCVHDSSRVLVVRAETPTSGETKGDAPASTDEPKVAKKYDFMEVVDLLYDADTSAITTTYADGVIFIRIPRIEFPVIKLTVS